MQKNKKTISESDNINKKTDLTIKPKNKEVLSKNQQTFNRLTKQIEGLENKIIFTKVKNERLLEFYSDKVQKKHIEKSEIYLKLAYFIDDVFQKNTFTKKQTEKINSVIIYLIDDVLIYKQIDDNLKLLYNKYAPINYDELIFQKKLDYIDMMANMTGIDIDLSEVDDTEDSFKKVSEILIEELQNKAEAEEAKFQKRKSEKKKTQKQIEKEKLKLDSEKIHTKNLKNTYHSLVKILHPDKEINELEKAKKEELMKKLTTAYNNKDIVTLIKLELEWLNDNKENIDTLTDEKLNLYNTFLKQQISELHNELTEIDNDSRFELIFEYLEYPENYALSEINKESMEVKKELDFYNKTYIKLSQTEKNKAETLNFVNKMYEDQQEEESLNMLQNELLGLMSNYDENYFDDKFFRSKF